METSLRERRARLLCGSSAQNEEWPMAKDKDDAARAQGFKRGLKGKRDAAGVLEPDEHHQRSRR